MKSLIDEFVSMLGDDGVVRGPVLAQRATSYWDSSPTEAKALLRPRSTEQLSDVMKICHAHNQSVVVQGGLTGIVEGAVATSDDVIVSLERMNQIESVDEFDGASRLLLTSSILSGMLHITVLYCFLPTYDDVWKIRYRVLLYF